MALDAEQLARAMLTAIKPVLKRHWADAKEFAGSESQKMATTLAMIAKLKSSGQLNEQQAAALLEMQKQSMQAVLLAVEGIGLIAAQKAINAALAAVSDAVNGAIGFPLL